MTKDVNRSAYTQRILEIVANINKQKQDINNVSYLWSSSFCHFSLNFYVHFADPVQNLHYSNSLHFYFVLKRVYSKNLKKLVRKSQGSVSRVPFLCLPNIDITSLLYSRW